MIVNILSLILSLSWHSKSRTGKDVSTSSNSVAPFNVLSPSAAVPAPYSGGYQFCSISHGTFAFGSPLSYCQNLKMEKSLVTMLVDSSILLTYRKKPLVASLLQAMITYRWLPFFVSLLILIFALC